MKMRFRMLASAASAVVLSHAAWAGPEWVEVDDAGDLPGTAQVVIDGGSGGGGGSASPLGRIKGKLAGLNPAKKLGGARDLEDMYLIQITDSENFLATTVAEFGGNADFDSNLWLFSVDGNGLLGNDDTLIIGVDLVLSGKGGGFGGSTLGSTASDGTRQTIPGPGFYLIAISGPFDQPANERGLIFDFRDSFEVSGPDGAGAGFPVTGWKNVGLRDRGRGDRRAVAGDGTSYEIRFNGAALLPPPVATLGLDIKPGACPNNFPMNSTGGIYVALTGTETFDVHDVNIDTVLMVRSDGWGGQVQPSDWYYADVATAFFGEECECVDLNGDGITDLKMTFSKSIMKAAFLLSNSANGELVPLTVCGFLNDGTPFTSHDCIRIVTN